MKERKTATKMFASSYQQASKRRKMALQLFGKFALTPLAMG